MPAGRRIMDKVRACEAPHRGAAVGRFFARGGGRPQVERAAAASRIAAAWLFFSLARAACTFLRGARCKVFL